MVHWVPPSIASEYGKQFSRKACTTGFPVRPGELRSISKIVTGIEPHHVLALGKNKIVEFILGSDRLHVPRPIRTFATSIPPRRLCGSSASTGKPSCFLTIIASIGTDNKRGR